jgi:hypothetical protein
MSYVRSYMNDARDHRGERWAIGTIRRREGPKRWFIALPSERGYETAYALVKCMGGEYFDGNAWQPIPKPVTRRDTLSQNTA